MGLFDFLTQEIAIDLGTANTIIIHNDKVVVDQPSIVAVDRTTGKVMAVGSVAMLMHGKTHENIKTIRPLRDGVIADFGASLVQPFVANGDLHSFGHHRGGKTCGTRQCRTRRCERGVYDTGTNGCRHWYWHRCGRADGKYDR